MAEGEGQNTRLASDQLKAKAASVVVPQPSPQPPTSAIITISDQTVNITSKSFSENVCETSTPPPQRIPSAAAAASSTESGNDNAQFDTSNPTIGGYRVHSSALAVPALASSHNIVGTTAAEQMAAIAASDQASRNSHDNTHRSGASSKASGRVSDFISRSLPLFLLGIVGYIYYVFVFRVCIRYYIGVKDDQTLAVIYLSIFNALVFLFLVSYARSLARSPGTALKPPVRKPPPPIPTLTTPYQPERFPSNVSQVSLVSNSTHSSTPGAPAATSINAAYPSYQATTPCVSQSTTAVSSPQEPVAPQLDVVISMADDDGVQRLSTAPESAIGEDGRGNPPPTDGSNHNQGGDDPSPIATLSICKRDGQPRWCNICKIVKPDRCHHCSECDQCVLRMDHHCPWVNGCVGYNNYKFFYLFILYGSIAAVFVVCTMVPLLVSVIRANAQKDREKEWLDSFGHNATHLDGYWSDHWKGLEYEQWLAKHHEREALLAAFDAHWVIISIFSFVLALLIVSFTAVHTSYILTNRTTIESLQDIRATFVKVLYKRSPTEAFLRSLDQSSYPFNQQERMAGMPLLLPSTMYGPSAQILFNVVMVEPGERLWDQGSWLANWKSIMGPTWWLWFVPYGNTPGDGIHDVYNEKVYERLVGDALAQARMQLANIGGLGDNGIGRGRGARPGRDGGYGTYTSRQGEHSKPRDKSHQYHSSSASGRGSSKSNSAGLLGVNKGGASTGQTTTASTSQRSIDHAEMLSSSQFDYSMPYGVNTSKFGDAELSGYDEPAHSHTITPLRSNPSPSSEPSSPNPSRSPSPDGRAGRATAGSRRPLKRMGTAPSIIPSAIRYQAGQGAASGSQQRVEGYMSSSSAGVTDCRQQASAQSTSSLPQALLVPSSAKDIPAAPVRHMRQRTLSSSRSQSSSNLGRGPSSSTFGSDFLSGGFGMGIDGDGIAVNSSMVLRLTTDEQRNAGGRSSPASSRKGHRRHHSARGSSDTHHRHHHHHHHHNNQHSGASQRALATPPISPDSDDAFPPPVPEIRQNTELSSSPTHTIPRSPSHDLKRPTVTIARHPLPRDDSSLGRTSKGKEIKGSGKVRAGRQRYRTVDGIITATANTASVEYDEESNQGVSGSVLPTPNASPLDGASLMHQHLGHLEHSA